MVDNDGAPNDTTPSGTNPGDTPLPVTTDGATKGAPPLGEDPVAEPTEVSRLSPIESLQSQALEASVIEVLKTCYDPEIPVDIYELGLIYGIEAAADGRVHIKMTLTSPACPVAGSMPGDVESRVGAIEGVTEAKVELVWSPPWSPERMSEAAQLELNM